MATIYTTAYYEYNPKYVPEETKQKRYVIDFSTYSLTARKHKFYELQRLCFAKGIGWCGTNMNLENYKFLEDTILGGYSILVAIDTPRRHSYLAYGEDGVKIEYREAIKMLRKL